MDVEKRIEEIKIKAYEYSKKPDKLPEYNQVDMFLFIALESIYALHNAGVYSSDFAKRQAMKAVQEYKMYGMWNEVWQNHLDKEAKVENLTIEMTKSPNVKTALEILYELIPPLMLQKSRINKELGVEQCR